MEQRMGGDDKAGLTGRAMWARLTTIARAEKESTPLRMEMCTKENGAKI